MSGNNMSAEVKILVEGTTNTDLVAETGEERTRPTITLIKDGDLIMVVDPGVLESQQVLIDALLKEGLSVDDVNVVCLTHSHIDHYRNIGMFPKAKTLEYYGLWDKESVEDWSEQFSTNIQVVRTPGHDYTGITFFVTTEDGVVAICGDLFWRENYPKNSHDDPYAFDPKVLQKSRDMVLRMTDWIIPGHGGMYKAEKTGALEIGEATDTAIRRNKEAVLTCRRCRRSMKQKDKCPCRPWLCYRCCECGLDCDLCSCSHRR